jgi:uncharacterized membrane protein
VTRTRSSRTRPSLASIDARLDRIETLLAKDRALETAVASDEKRELGELERIEDLERTIRKDLKGHPLTRITYHDITKGMIGSFFGVVGHFAFFEGPHLAESLSAVRASVLLLASMALLAVFLYFSGFRRVKEYHAYLPARFLVIYITAIGVATAVLFLFGILSVPIDLHAFYTNVAALSILAVMGAATADLIGGEA